jgi:hypothetical protein
MIHKKAAGKTPAYSCLSSAARMLSGAVRATLPVSSAGEPWQNKKLNSKNRYKR